MIRSMAYSRYFSTATAMHTCSTELPSSIVSLTSGPSDPKDSPSKDGTTAEATSTVTKTSAPLYSHLSCSRRSAPACRYLGTCSTTQPSRLAKARTVTAFPPAVQAAPTGYRLPFAAVGEQPQHGGHQHVDQRPGEEPADRVARPPGRQQDPHSRRGQRHRQRDQPGGHRAAGTERLMRDRHAHQVGHAGAQGEQPERDRQHRRNPPPPEDHAHTASSTGPTAAHPKTGTFRERYGKTGAST